MYNSSDRIKLLREQMGLTQSGLAKRLSLTRASVNAWEMGISVPSTPLLIQLSKIFHVTTDYLLGLDVCPVIRTEGLNEKEVAAIMNTIECFTAGRDENVE